jgi:uncharacterized lipoprotein YajG
VSKTANGLLTVVGLLLLVGCAGKGETVMLDLKTLPVAEMAKAAGEGPVVAVLPFTDGRADKSRVGARTHIGGGETSFNVPGGKPGDTMAKIVADHLKSKGLRAQTAKDGNNADVVITGTIQDLWTNAKSRFGSTDLAVRTKVAIQASNTADGSTLRKTLNGSGSDSVFWFSPSDVETLLNRVVEQSLDNLLTDTKVEGKALRMK